ncbi:hypothetical protein O5O51_15420 [Sinirhodobacter sp. HNIBRBA609]|nr:hypothetical protein O5O51_15420 [Sinirhodobacter sp. HNIBRBA609]
MPFLDADILFNEGDWGRVIETQEPLFRKAALSEISDRLRSDFYNGHEPGRSMPVIARNDWSTDLLSPYEDRTIGYDLPCLLSANRPTKGRVMLCAQDPRRNDGPAELTVGTFFGLDDNRLRTGKRHFGYFWALIRSCVMAGYDVWVTDAIKVFAGKDVLRSDPKLRELCFNILREEVNAFGPDKVLAIGRDARDALDQSGLSGLFSYVKHPNGQRSKNWQLEGATKAYPATTEGRFEAKTHFYCRALFGSDTPPSLA